MNDDDKYLRDFFAGLAMVGLMMSGVDWKAKYAYEVADEMMEARDKNEAGIAGIGKRKYTRKTEET
jgi:hypothetical protein